MVRAYSANLVGEIEHCLLKPRVVALPLTSLVVKVSSQRGRAMSTIARSLAIPSPQSLAVLGQSIHDRGLELNLPKVRSLVRSARGLGISPVLCQVALDPGAPTPVRERATAHLIRRVAAVSATHHPLERATAVRA